MANNVDIHSFILQPEATTKDNDASRTVKTRAVKTYEVELASGPDLIVSKRGARGGKTFMVLLVSQGQYYVKHSNGEITMLTSNEATKFLRDIPSGESLVTESAVWDELRSGKKYADALIAALNDEAFIKLAKDGLALVSAYVLALDSNPKSLHENMTLAADNQKLYRYFVESYAMNSAITTEAAVRGYLRGVLSKVRPDTFRAFVVINNVYGLDIARKAIDDFMGNDIFESLSPGKLCELFKYKSGYNSKCVASKNLMKGIELDIQFEANRFLEFLFFQPIEEGCGDNLRDWLSTWMDDLYLQWNVYGKVREKYPDILTLHHDKLAFMDRRRKKFVDKEAWEKAVSSAVRYEAKNKEWMLRIPRETEEMNDEATQMSNCVSSYTKRMSEGQCVVAFLRKANAPDKSVCTVEIRDGKVVQFRGRHNCTPTGEQYVALADLCKKVGLEIEA